MRRWNGWGDSNTTMALPDNGLAFLQQLAGPGHILPDAILTQVLATVPPSRLPQHKLIDTSAQTRLCHARGQSLPDWLALRSGNIGCFPDGVALPQSSEEVALLLAFCQANNIVVIPYGGGTSVAGHINPLYDARPVLTLSLARLNRLLQLDETSLTATFGAGINGPTLEAQLRAHGYTLGHFPQSFELSTLGGWIAARSSGQQSLRYGRIEQLFAGGRLETFNGTLELPGFPASAAGPDLRELVLGSEGRLGVITEAKVRISALPEKERFYCWFFPNWQQASDAVRALVQARVPLSMLRLSNPVETQTQLELAGHPRQIGYLERYLRFFGAAEQKCMLTLGITGSALQCRQTQRQVKVLLKPFNGISTGTLLGKKWAAKRFMMPYLRETLWQNGYVVDTLETATDWHNVDTLMAAVERSIAEALADFPCCAHIFSHLSHCYSQGCSIYTTIVFANGPDYNATMQRWQAMKHAASQAIVQHGGTISHQHGVGKDHARYLVAEKGELGMGLLRTLCDSMDPQALLTPGTLLTAVAKSAETPQNLPPQNLAQQNLAEQNNEHS